MTTVNVEPIQILPRLLVIAQLPPPLHGAAIISSMVVSSPRLRAAFVLDVLPIRMTEDLASLRRFGLVKVVRSLALYARLLWRLIARSRPSLVYLTLSPRGFALLRDAGLVAWFRAFQIPHVFHMHGRGVAETAARSPFWRRLYSFVFAKAHVIVLSERLYDDVALFVPRERALVVPNGVAEYPSDEEVARAAAGKRAEAAPTLLFLSNMLVSKGPLVFLDALHILAGRNLPFDAVFAGSWRDSITPHEFAAQVDVLALRDRVRYAGPVYGVEKDRLFHQSDVFVLPTNYENEAFPLVLLEASAYGLPIVTTNIAGLPDIVVENETGFIVRPGDAEELADRLQDLIADPALRSLMGRRARQHFKALYTSDVFERNLSTALKDIICGAKPPDEQTAHDSAKLNLAN